METPSELLVLARASYTQRQLAEQLGVSERTVARWECGETPAPAMLAPALRELLGRKPAPGGHGGASRQRDECTT